MSATSTLFSRRMTIVLIMVGAVIAIISVSQTWLVASAIPGYDDASFALPILGQDAAPVVMAMALVGLAAGIALTIVRTLGRIIIGIVVTVAGVFLGVATVTVLANPLATAAPHVASFTGMTVEPGVVDTTLTAWFSVLAALALTICGVVTLTFGRQWQISVSKKYESTAAQGSSAPQAQVPAGLQGKPSRVDEIDAWDDLSRGEDPT